MKSIARILTGLLAFATFSCSDSRPVLTEVAGTWISADQGTLILKPDGTFEGIALPTTFFSSFKLLNIKLPGGATFNGRGTWQLIKRSEWGVELSFNPILESGFDNFRLPLLYSKSRPFEGNEPASLFFWKGEAGEDRYEFLKK